MRVVKFAAIGFCLSIAILGTMASAPAKAGFIGETVSVDYHWPTLGTVYLSSGNAVVGTGVEFSSIGSFGPAADIADESFTITYSNTWYLSGGAAFDGLVLT
ncbi:MAG: hypothetical protein HOJ41_00105, partial [Rhodospirillaceae bacterium]|nr:hypothetical protein [Rhodospirillaceae bacterium]